MQKHINVLFYWDILLFVLFSRKELLRKGNYFHVVMSNKSRLKGFKWKLCMFGYILIKIQYLYFDKKDLYLMNFLLGWWLVGLQNKIVLEAYWPTLFQTWKNTKSLHNLILIYFLHKPFSQENRRQNEEIYTDLKTFTQRWFACLRVFPDLHQLCFFLLTWSKLLFKN